MVSREAAAARPRTTVEILDDAWRLFFADPVLLLSVAGLFQLPALTFLLLLLCQPAAAAWWWRVLAPALAAALLLSMGLSAGACQEVFHSWAEGYPVRFGQCLQSSLRRGLYHIGSQALTLVPPALLSLVCTTLLTTSVVFAVPLVFLLAAGWFFGLAFGLGRQPCFTAGQQRFWRGCRISLLASGRHFDRACVVLLVRWLMLLFAILNLHLFWNFALWTAENLAGIDVALLDVLCSLSNFVYLLILLALAWWLLTPFREAVDYLFFVDARTRYEGLDLWHRVEEQFPLRRQAKAGLILVGLGAGLLTAGAVCAEDALPAVRFARQQIAVIRKEVQASQPYPGGQRWEARLRGIADRLDQSGTRRGGFRWFEDAVARFPDRNQSQAVSLLDDLDTRLGLVQDSLTRPRKQGNQAEPDKDYIKSLVPPEKYDKRPVKEERPKEEPKKKPPVEDDKGAPGGMVGGGPTGPGIVGSAGLGAVAQPLLVVLVGVVAAVLVGGIALALYQWWLSRSRAKPRAQGNLPARAEDFLEDPDKQNFRELWQQADERARAGDYLGAVRTLYLAVLAMLHQARLIRYERTCTNGEYADQLRPRAPLHRPFLRLTGLFEVKWYGERACQPQDYRACRELAEELRIGSSPSA
jgi:hypothetical protein